MTDHYSVCETALQTILQGITGMSTSVKLSDYSLFDEGVLQFIVLQPDDFNSGEQSWGMDFKDWVIQLELFQRFTYESETMVNFRALRSNVINQIDKYPTLNGADGVVGISVSAEGGIRDVADKTNDSVVYYRMQTLKVIVRQQVDDITGGEYT